jgi:hypothetical protein
MFILFPWNWIQYAAIEVQRACMLHTAAQHDAPGSQLLLQLLLLLQMLLAHT